MHRHVDELSGRHHERPLATVDQMAAIGRRAFWFTRAFVSAWQSIETP